MASFGKQHTPANRIETKSFGGFDKPDLQTTSLDKMEIGKGYQYNPKDKTASRAKLGNTLGTIGDAGSAFFEKPEDPTVAAGDMAFNTVSDAMMTVNPLVGGIMKAGGLATDVMRAAGFELKNPTNFADKMQSSKLMSLLPTSILNTATKKKVDGSAGISKEINYGYAAQKELDRTDIGGVTNWFSKKFGGKDLVKRRRAAVERTNNENAAKAGVLASNNRNMTAATNSMQDVAKKNYSRLRGGYRTNVLAAKKGTKLNLKKMVDEVKKEKTKNVIPSGALHARKHNLPEEISEHVTNKGIPVISKNEKGDIIQHAEIEHSEIIFTKDVTNKLEDLLKKFENGDEAAAIKAGKLLSVEILENTEDNTNLIETV